MRGGFFFWRCIIGKGPKTTQTNTYTQLPVTPQVTQLQSMASQGSDPSIPFAYAQRREDINNSFQNPLGAYTSPAVRDASHRVANERMSIDESEAVKASKFNTDQANFGRQATVAGLTQPVQTSGTSTTNPGWGQYLNAGIGAGAQVGAAAL